MAGRSNCFFFAWKMFLTRGGYCAMRRSRHIAGWHWMWSPDLKRWFHYVPLEPRKTWLRAAIHKLWYRGRIKRGDD